MDKTASLAFSLLQMKKLMSEKVGQLQVLASPWDLELREREATAEHEAMRAHHSCGSGQRRDVSTQSVRKEGPKVELRLKSQMLSFLSVV